MIELCTKFERNRTIPGWVIDDLANVIKRGLSSSTPQRIVKLPNCSKFGENRAPSSLHQTG